MKGMEQVKKQYSIKTPCKDCPFRKDRSGIQGLRQGRITSIINDLTSGETGTFPCHKTVTGEDGEDVMDRKHCAGAMAVAIKSKGQPDVVSLAVHYGLIENDHYDGAMALSINPADLD